MCTQAKILNPFRGQEDCLYLNVWKQRNTSTSLLPVFVWIHGGGFLVGNGNFPGYSPNAHFIRKLGVVAVSMNYRLGPFGFMTLDVLSKNTSSNSSGNYALMDIIQSLKWIQDNIRFFGGDPNLVTIVGHSAGGKAVYALLASPLASGLFHRAVVMSGPPVYVKTFAETARDNAIFVDRANCSKYTDEETLRCLYNLTVEEVYGAVPWNVFPFWFQDDGYDLPTKDRFMVALAVVDPVVVPVSPLNLTNATDPNSSVPVLITSTAEETDVAATRNISSNGTKPLKEKVSKYLSTFSPALTDDALKHYLPKNKSAPYDAAYTYVRMSTDVRVTCPTNEALRRMTTPGRGPKYQMVVENKPNTTVTIYTSTHVYAYHGWDTFALFGFVRSVYGNISVSFEPTKEDFRFRDGIQSEFAHFVRYGHPKQKSWSPFPRAVAVYTDSGIVVQNSTYKEEQCKFWDANNFFPYGWML